MNLEAPATTTELAAPPADGGVTRVLLVEDNPGDARFIQELVDEAEPGLFAVERADRLSAAIARLRGKGIDLVLLDLSLPDSRGLQTFRDLHAAAPAVPVIVLTGLNDEDLALRAVQEGAQDYLVKGQGDGRLLVRAMRYARERARTAAQLAVYAEELRTRNALLEADLRLAREFQFLCLPAQYPSFPANAPPGQSALRFHHLYRPATAVGGDFFSLFALSDTQAAVFICDVMGHGLRAALITAVLRGLVEELKPDATDPGKFLAGLNHSFHVILRRTDETMLATAFLLAADVGTGACCFANAGHPSPFHLRRQAGKLATMREHDPRHGPALGLFADAAFPNCRFTLERGDGIVLFTDGLHEAQGPGGQEFGLRRVQEFLRGRLGAPVPELLAGLLATVEQFTAGRPFEDDVCLVGVDFAGPATSPGAPG